MEEGCAVRWGVVEGCAVRWGEVGKGCGGGGVCWGKGVLGEECAGGGVCWGRGALGKRYAGGGKSGGAADTTYCMLFCLGHIRMYVCM